jgi:S1-C subfamily serine protease
VPGDSGGALLDANGDVIGMNVAASSGSADVTGYAIPIGTVLDDAGNILAGRTTGGLTLGYGAALGVQLYTAGTSSPVVAGVVDGGAAAAAGISSGSSITSFAGNQITSADDLAKAVA